MGDALDDRTLADVLPGTWNVVATNFPMWLTGERLSPRFEYGLISSDPLVLSDEVAYLQADGQSKSIVGVDTWRGDEFVWRGKGLLRLFASHWSIAGLSDDGSVAVVRFSKSLVTPAGVDIIVRDGSDHTEVRKLIAHGTEQFGLTPEDFGSLSWLAVSPKG